MAETMNTQTEETMNTQTEEGGVVPSPCTGGEQCKVQNQANFDYTYSVDNIPFTSQLRSNVTEVCLEGLPCPPPRIGTGILGWKVVIPSVAQVGDFAKISIFAFNYTTDLTFKSIQFTDVLNPALQYADQLTADIYTAGGLPVATIPAGPNLTYTAPDFKLRYDAGIEPGWFAVLNFLVKINTAPTQGCQIPNVATVTGFTNNDWTTNNGGQRVSDLTNLVNIRVYTPATLSKKAYTRKTDGSYEETSKVECGKNLTYKIFIKNTAPCAIPIAFRELRDLFNNQFNWNPSTVKIYKDASETALNDITSKFDIANVNNELQINVKPANSPYIITTTGDTNQLIIVVPGTIECCRPNICQCQQPV